MAQAERVTNAIRAAMTGTSTKPSTSPVHAGHTALADHQRPIPVDEYAIDLDRADYLHETLNAFSVYATAFLATPQNVLGRLELRDIKAVHFDLGHDVIAVSDAPSR